MGWQKISGPRAAESTGPVDQPGNIFPVAADRERFR